MAPRSLATSAASSKRVFASLAIGGLVVARRTMTDVAEAGGSRVWYIEQDNYARRPARPMPNNVLAPSPEREAGVVAIPAQALIDWGERVFQALGSPSREAS